ncbi:MAG: HAMP domain-containing histidine kinase [Calothrix sp. C42_A2020_038]|nr:HAMP domain-containing histidine kinase [Calothrix sp. C42_A2020_038]
MYKWILPSLSEILAANQAPVACTSSAKAESQWRLSIAATEKLLVNTLSDTTLDDSTHGLVLAAPAPLFSQLQLTRNLQTITFTAKPFNPLALMPFQMPAVTVPKFTSSPTEPILPLLPQDPLASEQFCLVFTSKFQLVLILGEDENGNKLFSFSFEPDTVQQAWKALSARVMLVNPNGFTDIANLVQKYPIIAPDFRILMQFSQLLLAEFPEEKSIKEVAEVGDKEDLQVVNANFIPSHHIQITSSPTPYRSDVELLQAFAHEVRTPLATIRTTTRLLLKHKDLPANVIKRLQMIDHECTEQIDRMELLFRAAELETSNSVNSNTQLTPMCLEQILQQSIPRWQHAASRRNLKLSVMLPQKLPTVVSNPNMLDRVLTNLIENFARSLPPSSQLQVQVITAGNQLKLQLLPLLGVNDKNVDHSECTPPIRKAIGQLLMFQPETGTISLNLAATKHLFQAIGGKLIVRQRPKHGEVMTIFLPLETVDNSTDTPLGLSKGETIV